jgi:hypothetical protein
VLLSVIKVGCPPENSLRSCHQVWEMAAKVGETKNAAAQNQPSQ